MKGSHNYLRIILSLISIFSRGKLSPGTRGRVPENEEIRKTGPSLTYYPISAPEQIGPVNPLMAATEGEESISSRTQIRFDATFCELGENVVLFSFIMS